MVKAVNKTILLVEDDHDVRKVTRLLLARLGFLVLEAEDATTALDILGRHPEIDTMLSDVMMPNGMNGIELAGKARQAHQDLKILLTSGYPEAELRKQGPLEKEINILGKPYSAAALKSALESLGSSTGN